MGFSLLCTLTVSNSEFFDWCSIGVVFWKINLLVFLHWVVYFLPSQVSNIDHHCFGCWTEGSCV